MRSDQFFSTKYARLEHQSANSLTFRMIPCFSIFFSSHFSFSLRWMEHLRGGSMTGSQSCFRWSLATPLKSPRVSNWPGYACFNPSTVMTSGLGLRSSQ